MKLIQTKDYLLLIDEEAEIKIGDIIYLESGETPLTKQGGIAKCELKSSGDLLCTWRKAIAYYPLTKEAKELDLPLLPNPFKEDTDVEKLADTWFEEQGLNIYNSYDKRPSFIAGYKAAQSKQFSLEDMIGFGKKCFYKGFDKSENDDANSFTAWREECSKLIQSLSTKRLPISFNPEFEDSKEIEHYKIDGTNDGELIWKKKIKTITNSEGKEVVQGEWIY